MHHIDKTRRISTNMNQETEVCNKMFRSVICRVEKFEVKRSHRMSVAFETISILAAVAIVPLVYYILQSSSQSGFGRYMSLISSDTTYMMQNWKEFLMSAASSLPLTGGIVILVVLLVAASSLRRTVYYSTYSKNVKSRLSTI